MNYGMGLMRQGRLGQIEPTDCDFELVRTDDGLIDGWVVHSAADGEG